MKKKAILLMTFLTIVGVHHKLIAQNKNIEITYKRNSDKSVDISYTKELPGSYYLRLNFPILENCYPSEFEGVIKSSSGRLIELQPINKEQHVNFSYKYSFLRGVPNPKVDSLFNYTIPFKKGKKIKVQEASNLGEKYFGSEKPSNWKSYIVYTKSADTIHCMRKGIVVKITNKHKSDILFEKSYTSKRNSIIVEHSDGTYASYTGLKKNSFFVKLGQTVYPQTKIGIIEKFNKQNYRLSFAIYYLINANLESSKKQNLKNNKSQNEFLTPYFVTENGIDKLKSGKEHTVTFNKTILFEELTRREKRKQKKNPNIYD